MGGFLPWLGVSPVFDVTGQLSNGKLGFQTGVKAGQFPHHWEGEEDVGCGSWEGHDGRWPDHSACYGAGFLTHTQESDP